MGGISEGGLFYECLRGLNGTDMPNLFKPRFGGKRDFKRPGEIEIGSFKKAMFKRGEVLLKDP